MLPVGACSIFQIELFRRHRAGTNSFGSIDRYLDEDDVHYEGFNYADDSGQVRLFRPNSDMSFNDFRKTMMDEWNSRRDPKL